MGVVKAVYLIVLVGGWSVAASVVATAQGAVRGELHQGYVSYTGIPYASLTDDTRFKRASLAPWWSGVRESTSCACAASAPACCLTLDVHAPAAARAPVLAWVRGGGGPYDPGALVREGVMLVVISHRLGPSGFLCLDDERIPGNAGVKDVVLALRWIRDNIAAFQGDPHKVVVAGQGFAAAMVEALVVAPMAEGLFHGAILQSGTLLSPWAFSYDAGHRALMLAQTLDEREPVAAILNASNHALTDAANSLRVPYFPFGMCVERGFKHEERLLSDSPIRLLSNKYTRKVPIIIGSNSDEAYVFLSLLKRVKLRTRRAKDLSMLLPEELTFANEDDLLNVVTQIRNEYFKGDNFSMGALLAYHRDAYFTNHIDRSARLHASANPPVYHYRFSHAGAPGVRADHRWAKSGAAHSDELAHLFPDGALGGADGAVQKHLIRLWTNFVKYLDPTPASDRAPRWDPTQVDAPRLLDISEDLVMQGGPGTPRLWDDIYERFYYKRGNDNI